VLVVFGVLAPSQIVTLHIIIIHMIMLAYLIIFKQGSFIQKVFGVLIILAISAGTSIIGAGLASIITATSIKHTLIYYDTSRLLALIFIKTFQLVVVYILAKRHERERNLRKIPTLVLFIAVMLDFAYLISLRLYLESPDLQPQQNYLIVWLAVGALLIMFFIFVMYEIFIREEARNVELVLELQRTKLKKGFLKEMDKLYSAITAWEHEYINNLTTLRTLVIKEKIDKAIEFMDNMNRNVIDNEIMLHTGNIVLDAIVSAKLVLARTQGIEVDIQVVFPENNYISDNDLCVVAGNIIDNAIEACVRMENTNEKKFIEIIFIPKGKNLLISIRNSYNNEVQRKGKRFFTVKSEPKHGIGNSNVDAIVKKYHGHVLRSPGNGVFETNIMLPLVPPVG
jgi:predicted RecB family endonuclease